MSSVPFPAPEYKLHLALAIYALRTRSSIASNRKALMEIVARAYPDAPALEQEVMEIQKRLGKIIQRNHRSYGAFA